MQDWAGLIGFQNAGVGALAGAVVGVGMYAWLSSSGKVLKKGEWVEFVGTAVVNLIALPFGGTVIPTTLEEDSVEGMDTGEHVSSVEKLAVREISFELSGYRVRLDTHRPQIEVGDITSVLYDEKVSHPYLCASWVFASDELAGYWRVEKLVMPKQVVFTSATS